MLHCSCLNDLLGQNLLCWHHRGNAGVLSCRNAPWACLCGCAYGYCLCWRGFCHGSCFYCAARRLLAAILATHTR